MFKQPSPFRLCLEKSFSLLTLLPLIHHRKTLLRLDGHLWTDTWLQWVLSSLACLCGDRPLDWGLGICCSCIVTFLSVWSDPWLVILTLCALDEHL